MAKKSGNEYADAGVDYTKLEAFKDMMIEVGKRTTGFPNIRNVCVVTDAIHAHGAVFEYTGDQPHIWCKTQEGLGNLNWIAEWMLQFDGTKRSRYDILGRAAALLIAIDVIAQGAMPVIWTDEIAAGDSDWFTNKQRAADYAQGCFDVCKEIGMALPAGESPALKYLIKAEPPVTSAPSLSGSITGIIAPKSRLITGAKLRAGDVILGAPSSGLHSNGISLVIKEVMKLSDQFLTKLNGQTVGEECLIPIPSYVKLVEALLENEIEIHAILPATGDGVGKIAFDKRPFTYRVHTWWPKIPPLFLFMKELGVTLEGCLKTFNWGAGIYFYVPRSSVDSAVEVAAHAGYDLLELGRVEEGERKTIFEPESVTLPPPGE
ncbi:MAG: AIR synthase-related protein [Patescibacteria group bacterium]|nr:AIR synthase-related protein [Patescibacteria group bacterium]